MWGGITYPPVAVAVSEQPGAGFISAEKTAFSEWVLCADGHAVPSCTQCFFGTSMWGWYHYPRRALCAVEMPDGRLQKRLTCRFLRSGGRSSPHDSYFLANTQNFMSADPVANTFALWYNKSKELEEFQNNYAVKFPFAIASSSPGPRPEQQKGSAIP